MVQRSDGRGLAAVALVLLLAGPAAAQLPSLPGGGGGLPGVPGGGLPTGEVRERVTGTLDDARDTTGRVGDLTSQRVDAVRDLIRRNRREIDVDERGGPVVRGQLLAVEPSAASLAAAQAAGFGVLRRETLEGGLEVVILSPPPRLNARQALKRLRQADPAGDYDFNHIYSGAGEAAPLPLAAAAPVVAGFQAGGAGVRVGLVDTGVDARHPALAVARIEQRGFAPGGVRPAAHGTAAASLLAGQAGGFRGAAPGATVLAADVYGAGPTGGSADAVARALGWMEASGVPVINISLVGPPNALVRAMVRRLSAKGVLLVAAVGNDGPAAPPLYPAAWPEVISVTGVDRRDRVLPEACRGTHVDFAAPGSDMAAARPGGGFSGMRGTSFAAPLVAGKLALLRRGRGPAQAVAALGAEARDLGARGPDRVYGRGLVAGELRMAPPGRR
ncbi:MAG: peptidase [Caulobacter sp.]|jgi:subtilisin family serine protease|nr:peptidase [Caulobacter sp.]